MKSVIIIYAPISERYWTKGVIGTLDESAQQIRVGGCWFDFNSKWKIKREESL